MYSWSLDSLYKGLDDKQYLDDFKNIEVLLVDYQKMANTLDEVSVSKVTEVLKATNNLSAKLRKLMSFLSLNQSVDTINMDYKNQMQKLMQLLALNSEASAQVDLYLGGISNLDKLCDESEYILEHKFYLQQLIDNSKYQLLANEEGLIAKLNLNGVNTWQDLYNYATATLKVDYLDKEISLTEVRNLAYSDDSEIRKNAYLAELASYHKIEDSVAFSLNSIKGYVNTMVDLRGYKDSLDMTLKDSLLEKETLDAMFKAIDKSLPKFRQYYKHKAKLLDHKNGLPFYDLFAPVAKSEKTYSIKDAQEMILKSFKTFSDDLHDLVKQAFDKQWIDYLPKENKRGGAFCANLPFINESRILSNFSEDLSSVVTLAHELGHAYHGYKIQDHQMLNTSYVMPIAETASNFCELILSEAALEVSDTNEKILLLENMISDAGQVIVDIYSRFLFETEVFESRKNQFLMAKDLKEIMEQAQIKTYGDGLDKDYLHGYMWVNKGHYYSGSRSYYNFPYAYGGLFSKGLYAKYLEDKEDFVEKYENMLEQTTILNCEDIGDLVGVNVRKQDFWDSSLAMIEDMIDEFISLTSQE